MFARTFDGRSLKRRARIRCKRAREHPRAARKSDRGGFLLSSFLTNHGVVVALVCAACAVVYRLVTARSLLALSPGNDRMQSLSLAVQQGARPYLNRQYTTISAV